MKKTSFTSSDYGHWIRPRSMHWRSPLQYVQILLLALIGAVSAYGQVGPNCTHINASVGLDDTARVTVAELITNIATIETNLQTVDILIEGSYGQRIFYQQGLVGMDEIALYACPLLGQQLKVNASITGGGGSCWSYLTFKQGNAPIVMGRSKTVYCFDPLVHGGDIHGIPPMALVPCRGTEDATFVADWIDARACIVDSLGTPGNDTAKIIFREYEAFNKDGQRGVGFDTIYVLRLPQITVDNAFCPERDTVYCGVGGKLGPYMVVGREFEYGAMDLIDRYQAVSFIETNFNETTGLLEFAPAEFDPKCGISVHVDAWLVGDAECSSQYRVEVEIKQSCWGTPGLYTGIGLSDITNFADTYHPKHWVYARNTGGDITINGSNQSPLSAFDGTSDDLNPDVKLINSAGATSVDIDDASMCIQVPQDGDLMFNVAGSDLVDAGYRLNGTFIPLANGGITLSLQACDEICFEARNGEQFTVDALVWAETAIAAPLDSIAPGYWRCEFWVIDLDTLAPLVECQLDLKANPDLIHEDTLYVPASSHDCGSHTYVPPVEVIDDWSGVKYVKAIVEGVTTVVFEQSATDPDIYESHKQVKIPHGLPVRVIYEAYDSCHNIGNDTCYLKVKDLTRPVPVCDKGVIVGLSGKKVWVNASTFDEGSWDNCDINLLLARRVDWTTACVDLCDDDYHVACYDEHDTIWCSDLETDKHVDEVEAHYYKTMKWLKEDGRPCTDILWNAWKYDLCKYRTLECVDHPYPVDDHYFKKLLKELECEDEFEIEGSITDEDIDLWDQIGGGWSDAVPFDCEDACQEVMVEILAMDYWCNWAKCWTWVWVEDKTPVEVVHDVDDRVELTCGAYKHESYDYAGSSHPVSIQYIVDLAKTGDTEALAALDGLFGGYDKVWRDEYGNVPDPDTATYYDKICQCSTYTKKEKVFDEHLGYVWKDIYYDSCYYTKVEHDKYYGQVVVNCGESVQCEQTVWCSFDHCGQGYVYRKWKFIPGCEYDDGKYNPGHRKDTIVRKQLIWVGNSCELDKGMFTHPEEAYVFTCGIEYDDAGNATGALAPENTGQPEYLFDDDCRIIGINHTDKVFKIVGGDEACYKVVRTWYFIDWCYLGEEGKPLNDDYWWINPEYEGITKSWEQKIVVQDTTPPVCTFEEPLEEVEAAGCAYTLRQTVNVTDMCGTLSYFWELFEVKGSEKISIASDSDELSGTDTSFEIEVEDLLTGDYKLKVRVTDECQNESYCEDYFTVITGKKPAAICITSLTAELTPMDLDQDGNIDTAMATVWANEFDRSSAPACDSDDSIYFRIELIDGVDDTTFVEDEDYITVGCDYLGTQMVRLWVIDESGSFDFCDVLLVVQNNMGGCGDISNSNSSITGNIENELNESVQQVQVKAELENGQMLNYITNATGAYAFATALGQRVVVQPTKDVDDMNGISTLDLVKIQKHILAKEALANQYREIAADINNDGRISSLDLVHLRKLILGKVDELSDSDSWRFFSTLNNQEKYTIDPLDEAMRLDWVAVKIGDINLDHDPSRAADRSGNNLVFNVDDFSMNVGSQYAIDVRANNFNDIAGYQYTLKFDPAAFDVTNIKMAEGLGLNDENFALNRVGQGAITTSWNHFEGISVDPETVLFTLIIEAKKAVALSEAMTINSSVTPAEAYNSQDQISDIALNFNSEAVAPNEFVLLQNRPNPFTDATAVGFHLPEATNITLTVFDVTGKVVHVRTGDFAKGYNEILIKKKELTASGVLYYQLDSETYTATKKMIHVK